MGEAPWGASPNPPSSPRELLNGSRAPSWGLPRGLSPSFSAATARWGGEGGGRVPAGSLPPSLRPSLPPLGRGGAGRPRGPQAALPRPSAAGKAPRHDEANYN